MKHRSAFCTLDAVLRQLALASSKTADYNLNADIDALIATIDANNLMRLKDLIYDQSEQLYNTVHRVGIPYRYAWTLRGLVYQAHMEPDFDLSARILLLPDDLLEVSSLVFNGTTLTENTDFYTSPDNAYPAQEIAIPFETSLSYPSQLSETIVLTAIFGYHNNPSDMWVNSSDTIQDGAGINTSAGTITVADANGNNVNGVKRFETLHYIKIDSEFMLITGIDTATNILTVRRAVNGTVAAAHDNGATIYTYQPNDLFEETVRRRVVFLYNNPSETRRIVPLPDGTVQLDDENRIPLPPKRDAQGVV
jgi:hypothetical protein